MLRQGKYGSASWTAGCGSFRLDGVAVLGTKIVDAPTSENGVHVDVAFGVDLKRARFRDDGTGRVHA
jgi:hypothetical protein